MQTQKIYCGGEFISTAQSLTVNNPFNNSLVATTYLATEKEVELAIKKAEACKAELAQLSSYQKFEILKTIAEEITKNKQELAAVLSLESAKPLMYALAEIERSALSFLIAAEECKRLPKEFISLDWSTAGKNKEGLIKHFPIGIVAGIAPFNFPMNLAVHKIAPAIAAGCPIILKPASATPLSTLKLAEIIDKTNLPKGALSVLPMNRTTGNLLVTDERFALLSFTGSPEVGWQMKKNAGKKKVVLELGGNAGTIITESANLNDAITKCVKGGFAYSGQICIHAQRIFVHQKLFKDFIETFVSTTNKLKTGNPQEANTEFSCMIDEANAMRVENWLAEAVSAGAKILCGGKRNGNYFEPTIVTNTTTAMKINAEEVFGPIVCVESFDTIESAVALVNNSKFGLQCGVFTNAITEMDYCFEHLQVGGVILNDVPTLRFDHMPYGGIKESGLGREGIKYALQDMLEAKILVK